MPTFQPTERSYRGGARTLPRDYFTAPEVFAAERARLFARRWLCVGREEQLDAPGRFLTVPVAGESVIVVRDRRGEVRAFYNVCRHRGTRICEQKSGAFGGSIQCPYHAWTYDLDGQLIGAPHMKEVDNFDWSSHALHPISVAAWEGFLFLNLAPDPEPLGESLGPVRDRFSRFGLARLRPARRIEYEVRANWKLIVLNYSECLHCPVIHPDLARLSPYSSGENDLVDGPYLGGFMLVSREGGSMTTSGRSCGVRVGNLPTEDLQRVYYYSLFPSLLLSLHPDYVMYHTLRPERPDFTHVTCEWLFHPDTLASDAHDPDDAVSFWDKTNRQDWHICEQSQAGISSRAYAPGPYSPRESLLAAWDREYLRQMEGSR